MRFTPLSTLLLAALALAPLRAAHAQASPTRVQVEPPPASADGAASALPTAEEAFGVRAKVLEDQVGELKEKVLRTKARLLLLQETALGGEVSQGAHARLVHHNQMGEHFVLESATYALDGVPVFSKVDSGGSLAGLKEFEVFSGRVMAGQHLLAVKLVYRGTGAETFKKYEGYRFRLQSTYSFQAQGGKLTQVRVVGYEKGGDVKDRPALRYDVAVTGEPPPAETAPAPAASAGGAGR